MTTSPFGTPNPFDASSPQDGEPAVPQASLPSSKRTPLLIGLVGVAAAAAIGTGLFFFTQSGSDPEDTVAQPAPGASEPAPESTPTDTSTPLPTLTEFNGRNPFAAQVVVGGVGAAPASTPVAVTAPVSSGSSAFNGGGSTAGVAGTDGRNGRNGKDGATGPAGPAGATPQYIQVTFRVGVAGDPIATTDDVADFEVVTPAGVAAATGVEVDEFLGTEGPATWVKFLSLQLDADDAPVAALVQMGDRIYVLPLDQAVTLFQSP